MASQKIRIKLKAYEHSIIDQSAARIVESGKRTGQPACPDRSRCPRKGDRDDHAFAAQAQGFAASSSR